MTAPGWYHAPMDPPGTARYWDGYGWTIQLQGATPAPARSDDTTLAPIWARIGARAVDFVLAFVVAGSLARAAVPRGLMSEFEDGSLVGFRDLASSETIMYAGVLSALVFFVWEFLWLVTEGATPGKQLFGLYVVDPASDRGSVSPMVALKRSAHRVLYLIPTVSWVTAIIGSATSLVMMASDGSRHQSLMDRFANTTVRRLPPGSPRWSPWFRVWVLTVVGLRLAALAMNWDFYRS